MQLPIVSPAIKHCPTEAYLLSIPQCYPQTDPWIFNNFLNIMMNRETGFNDFLGRLCFLTALLFQNLGHSILLSKN